MASTAEQTRAVSKLTDMMRKIDICMLTTVGEDGSLHSRPMSVNGQVEENGDFWFFTYGNTHKVIEARKNPHVSVTFSDIGKQDYVSVAGTAQLVRDRVKIEQLWKPELKAWFPDGIETSDIALLKITAEKAEYWDEPSSLVSHTVALFQTMTGAKAEVGDNKKVDLK